MATPMWRQIADDLRTKIEAGELGADGQPLPTELDLQDIYSASRNTVRDAVGSLVNRGLLYKRSGQGTFVNRKPDPFVTKGFGSGLQEKNSEFEVAVRDQRRAPVVTVPRVEIQPAAGLLGEELQLPADASLVSRHQRRLIDNVPYSLQTTFYPMSLVEEGAGRLIRAEDILEGAMAYIEDAVGIKQAGWRDRISVRAPDSNEESFFGLPDDGRVAVLEIIRTSFDQDSRPFRVTITTYPADRNQFVTEAGKVPADSGQGEDTQDSHSADPSRRA